MNRLIYITDFQDIEFMSKPGNDDIEEFRLLSCDYGEAAAIILKSAEEKDRKLFIHINLNNYYILKKKVRITGNAFKNSILFFEGIAMKAGFLASGRGSHKDINGTDLFPVLIKKLDGKKKSIFLLGAGEQEIAAAAGKIAAEYHGVQVAGYHCGYYTESEESSIVGAINSLEPDLLMLGMGMKKEAEFIERNYGRLQVGAIWAVGGLFDFLSGKRKRAPVFIRSLRLEWLYRFFAAPGSKFFRNFVLPFWFFGHIIKNRKNMKIKVKRLSL